MSSSIEGLEYSAVTVVLAEAVPTKVANVSALTGTPVKTTEVLPGLSIKDADLPRFWQGTYAVAGIFGVLLLTNVSTAVALLRGKRGRRKGSGVPYCEKEHRTDI